MFLPIPMSVHGKPQTTYHLGPYGSQKPVDLKVFDSLLNSVSIQMLAHHLADLQNR